MRAGLRALYRELLVLCGFLLGFSPDAALSCQARGQGCENGDDDVKLLLPVEFVHNESIFKEARIARIEQIGF